MLAQVALLFVLFQQPVQDEIVNFDPVTFFDLSPEMKNFMDEYVMVHYTDVGRLNYLLEAIFDPARLNMTYSNHQTTTPIETFALKSGNCLSFTAMFIAMARYCEVDAKFQEVSDLSSWTQKGDFTVYNRHMNCSVFVDGVNKEVDFNYLNKKEFRLVSPATDKRGIAHFYNNFGAESLGNGNISLARLYIEKAIEMDPEFSFGWTNLGILHRLNGDYSLAEDCYKKASKLNSKDHTPLLNLAYLYRIQGKEDQAGRLMKKVKRFLALNPFHHYELGRAAFDSGQYEAAVIHFKHAVKLHDTHPRFLLALAAAYQKVGRTDKATRLIEKAKKQAGTYDEKALYDKKLQLLARVK